jgi:hypothetical protein
MSEQVFCYAARKPGMPGFCACVTDDPAWAEDTAKTVEAWISEGRVVARVTIDEAREGLAAFMRARMEAA